MPSHRDQLLPLETVRDLLGIVRALYRAERGHTPVGAKRLRELEAIGRELRTALEMARKTPDPDTLGHRAAWNRAERATQRLIELVDDFVPARPAILASAAKVRRR